MAGRGTDIVLGGNLDAELAASPDSAGDAEQEALRRAWELRHQEVIDAGGLHIIGTERHESRRIDNQLRGRSGRQGDPGSSRFYLSMEDNLMRIFGDPERTKGMLERVGMQEGEAIESKLLTRQIERAQRKVEAHNFDMRKSLLEYDDVSNDQRTVVYQQRNELMEAEDLADAIVGIRHEVIGNLIGEYVDPESPVEEGDLTGLEHALRQDFGAEFDIPARLAANESMDREALETDLIQAMEAAYEAKTSQITPEVMRQFEKVVMLGQLDTHWKEHLAAMDYLRQGIHLRGYAQKNPKQEYKREAFDMFGVMLDQVKHSVISIVSRAQLRSEQDVEAVDEQRRSTARMQFQHAEAQSAIANAPAAAAAIPGQPPMPGPAANPVTPFVRTDRKVGRNEPCPCGSGKKYKRCHGNLG
jgi:preprotein translocase subunit SecA